jgi:hypothetical protein
MVASRCSAPCSTRRSFLRMLRASQAILPAVNLLDLPLMNKLLDNSRQETPPAVAQFHAVRDLADAGGLRKRGDIRDDVLPGQLAGLNGFRLPICVLVFHVWISRPKQANGIRLAWQNLVFQRATIFLKLRLLRGRNEVFHYFAIRP